MSKYSIKKPDGKKVTVPGGYRRAFANALTAYEETGKIAGWEYRPKIFTLWDMGTSVKYRPDFVITAQDNYTIYIDIRKEPSENDRHVSELFKKVYPERRHLFIDKSFFGNSDFIRGKRVNDLVYVLEVINSV